ISYREDITGGYHLESITFYDDGGGEIDKTSVGFKDEESIIYFMVTAEIDAIKIVIEANTNVISIQAGVSIDGATQTPSSIGGYVYLTDANGNLLGDDSYISEGVTNFMKGANYIIETKTGSVIYLVLSEVSGFVGDLSANGPGNVAIGSSMKTNDDGKEVKVYSLSGITGATSVIASFRAETFKVNASLVSDLDTLVGINGGVIAVEENKTILAGINNQYFVQASAVNGSDVVLTVKSRLGYHLYDSGTSNYVCYSIQTESGVTSYAVAGSIDDWATTGYSQKLSIKLENITENVNVYILVIPNAYTVNFVNKIGDKEATLGSTTITYGQSFSGLAREILYPEAPEDYYSFNGYWTKELSQGSQYIDKGSLATSGWKETGYYFNGAQYVAQEHFDVNNNTFTLYAGWTFKKAKLTFSFGPSSVVASYAYGIRSLVLNDDTDKVAEDEQVILWTTQSNVWYGEVYYGSVLKVQAPSFDGYEFVRIVVSHNGLDYNYTNQTCTLNAFEEGEYGIAIIYHPIFSIAVQNKGATSTDGGSAWIEQDG
ncbi:MAG: hypothetical protein IJX25_03865, partial [Clostridia bacterium]|nr:hypothetical protein [Clostridia bacterium]